MAFSPTPASIPLTAVPKATKVTHNDANLSPRNWQTVHAWSIDAGTEVPSVSWRFGTYRASGTGHEAELTIALPVPVAGRYRLTVSFNGTRREYLYVNVTSG